MNRLFFDLIRVSIDSSNKLPYQPTAEEWKRLYDEARKHSLLGVCFAGVRRNIEYVRQTKEDVYIPMNIYHQWLGVACNIQQYNEQLNHYCIDLEQKLLNDGLKSCILKGQGLNALYGTLINLRQPGDIDIWPFAGPREIIAWARKTGALTFYDYHHADISLFKNVDIELHYRPTLSRNLLRNVKLQKWFKNEGKKHIAFKEELGFSVPDYVFNVILILNHNFWHLLFEGIGLRQVLDLYFVLRSIEECQPYQVQVKDEVYRLIKHFQLQRFAAASMWIMQEVLGLEEQYFICKPNKDVGSFLLDEIMKSGNFGKFDKRLNKHRYKSRIGLMFFWFKHNLRLFRYYPEDVLWSPIGILRISVWRRWYYRNEHNLK